MNKGSILIIDDEEKLRGLMARILSLEGYKVFEAPTGRAGLKTIEKEEIQVIISDVKLPDANGIELVSKIISAFPLVEIIIMTAYGTIPDGVKAMKLGAFDYITKGEGEEQIIPTVSRAMEKAMLQSKVYQLERKIGEKYTPFRYEVATDFHHGLAFISYAGRKGYLTRTGQELWDSADLES